LSSFVQDICGAVQTHAAEVPDKIFHIFLKDGQKTAFTFSGLWRRSGNFAAALLARGVGQGDIVIVSLPMGPDLVSGFLGAMRAGAIPSIMPYPNAKQKSDLFWAAHRTLFDRIDPSCFILSPAVAKLFAASLEHLVPRILVTDAVPDHQPAALPIDPGAIAFLQHSSGTTALKKGVKLTHGSVVSHVQAYARSCGIDGDSRVFSWLPLYHDMGLIACLIMPMVIGCTVTAMDNFEWVTRPTAMLEAISRDRLEFAWMPNFGFAHLVRSCPDPSKFDLSTLKALINCSEPCRPETHALFVSHFARAGFRPDALQVCYAMAENVFAVSQTTFGEPARQLAISMAAFDMGWAKPAADGEPAMHIASCGAPLPEVNVRIVDDARVPLEAGRVGEVAIRTDCLFSGYNGRPDLTERALVDGIYYTGDLGFMHDGELYLTGRKDDLILAYGRNLLAHELEAIVNKVEGVKPGRAVVFDVASEQLGSNVVIVMAEALPSVDVAELTRAIRAALDAGAGITPQQVILLREGDLLKTTSGKISRSGNRTAYLAAQQERAA
jgi:fatty-acyl-CoA synthase